MPYSVSLTTESTLNPEPQLGNLGQPRRLKAISPSRVVSARRTNLGSVFFSNVWSRGVARWFRWSLSVADPFVSRCLTSSALLPFPHPAHRTGRADLPHPALGEDSRNRRSHCM